MRVGVLAATVVQPHVKQRIDPLKVIPPPYRPQYHSGLVTKPQAVVDRESPRAWAALDRFFTQSGKTPETYVIRAGGK